MRKEQNPMRTTLSRTLIALAVATGLNLSAAAEEATEHLTTKPMVEPTASRAFLADLAISHIADGRLHIVDAANGSYLGVLTTGYLGQFIVTPDRKQVLISAGYYSRLDKGERADVLQIYDLGNLKLQGEVILAPKRAQALPYRGLLQTSSDGQRVYVQNATPATSVTVIDLASRQILSEVQTPGCWSIFPSATDHARFSTLCGDGTMLTIALDDKGATLSQVRSKKFFDADIDPVFIHGEKVGNSYYFISFNGVLHQLNLEGDTPLEVGSWPLAVAGWRPGGYGPLAINPGSGLIYLAMHPNGKEGSHKVGAKEIWEFDLTSKKLLRRAHANQEVSLAVTHSGAALLVGVDAATAALHTYDGVSLKLKKSMKPVGDMPVQVEMQ